MSIRSSDLSGCFSLKNEIRLISLNLFINKYEVKIHRQLFFRILCPTLYYLIFVLAVVLDQSEKN